MEKILIKNGRLISKDHDSEIKDILAEKDKIKKIESRVDESDGLKVIDARGRIVTPGFINIHSHGDFYFTTEKHLDLFEPVIRQGVTSCVGGNCGFSIFPFTGKNVENFNSYSNFLLYEKIDYKWGGYKEYKEYLKGRMIMNLACLTGCGTLRVNVAGFERNINEEQFKEMEKLLVETLENGVFGISSGLMYMPGTFSTTDELIRLARIAKRYPDTIYTCHTRGSSETFVDAIKEVIEVAEKTGIKVHCAHMGPETPKFNNKVYEVIEVINQARKRGVDITYDSLSYPGGCTTIMAIFPPWSYENGTDKFLKDIKDESFYRKMLDYMETFVPKWPTWERDGWTDNFTKSIGWENLFILGAKNKSLIGKNFLQIAEERKTDLYITLRDVLLEENADMNLYFRGSRGAVTFDDDEDLKYFDFLIENDLSHVSVDAVFSKGGTPTYTPYMYGAYPRIINRYVKKKKTLTLKQAIERFTSKVADRIGIKNRGYLREGYYADIAVIDYENYRDYPVILEEQKYTDGVDYLMVNGELTIDGGNYKKAKAGMVISKI